MPSHSSHKEAQDGTEEDVTAANGPGLGGRTSVALRPLPTFRRPGVVLAMGDDLKVVSDYDIPSATYSYLPVPQFNLFLH
jgi:hypothetical protein